MAFARARLIPMPPSSGGGQSTSASSFGATSDPPPADDGFYVAFNPTTLKLSYSSTLEGGNARGKKQSQYIGKQSTELAVELIFDTTDVDTSTVDQMPWGDADSRSAARSGSGDVDVRVFTQKVAQMMGPKKSDDDKPAPPRVQFVWGSFLFEGVLKSLTETIELFSAEGIPLRATLAVTLSEDALEFRRASAEGGSVAPLTTPQRGSTAAAAARRAGLDPQAGKAIAALNGLDDLRSLPDGTALVLPAVGGSASFGVSASASASASASIGISARGSASFGISASASAGGSFTGGFGGGAGLSVTIGGGGGFGLEAGAGASAGFGVGLGVSAGFGVAVSGGVSGGVSASVSLPGAGAVGGPGAGGSPGAQSMMSPGGKIARSPAAPSAPLPPASTTSAGSSPTTRTSPTLVPPGAAASGTPSSPAAALGTSAVSVAAQTGGSRVAATIGLVARTSLPGGAAPASGAFRGISGIPRKTVKFGIAGPTVRALAYPRLPADDTCAPDDRDCPDAPAVGGTLARIKKTGGCCGCGH